MNSEKTGLDSAGGWEFVDEYTFVELPRIEEKMPEVPATGHNVFLEMIRKRVMGDAEVQGLWKCSNVIAMNRLGFSDHGKQHVEIVANNALNILKLLSDAGVQPSCVKDYGLSYDDAEIIVYLAACLHDIGHTVHRDCHTQYSVWLAMPVLNRLLDGIYTPEIQVVARSEILHCISAHHKDTRTLSVEAGVLRLSDALDMARGRTRLWDDAASNRKIHAVSARAIESVEIWKGRTKPVLIKILMSGSAGVFQVDELLMPKLRGSGIEDYVQIEARVACEKQIVNDFVIE